MFADVVLPLAVLGAYTYRLPENLGGKIVVGSRVVVPLGKAKRYTGIVIRVYDTQPALSAAQLKDIEEVVDERPLLLETQIELWRWVANYYMCHPGEVMKAALPAGLKLESETLFALTDEGRAEVMEGQTIERAIVRQLDKRAKTLTELRKAITQKGVVAALHRLVERGVVEVEERVSNAFKNKTERHVRLAATLLDPTVLQQCHSALARSPRQQAVFDAYLELSEATAALTLNNAALFKTVRRDVLIDKAGTGASVALAALVKRGFLEVFQVEVDRLKTQKALPNYLERPLSLAQQTALTEIQKQFETHAVVLLKGVTASGKTEVYTQLIRQTLDAGKQVLYLLPEIALTTQITTRLGKCFGERMGIYHSKFPDAERVELWQRQLSDDAFPLILGVRSALFLPFRNLGLIVIDEEHETSYKQQDPAPRYHARDAAIMMAHQQGAKVLLGTATPSLETYTNALNGKYGLVRLDTRFGEVDLPHIVVEDLAELHRKKILTTPFSPRLKRETEQALSTEKQAIFFLNRRGYSRSLQCNSCGWTPHCQCCDVALTFHQKQNKVVCHYCGTAYEVPTHCPQCEKADMRDIGTGTEKIEAAVEACFPDAVVGRMDLDTTRSRSAYEQIISDFQHHRTNLLVGTQMVTKGLDFSGVTVVGILNADQMLNQCDFRAHERAFQMMTQVAGRAGRRSGQGVVVVQTRQPSLPIVEQVVRGDYEAMYEAQMADRHTFRFPPAVRLIYIYLKHRDVRKVNGAARLLGELLQPHFGTNLLGPDKPVVSFVQRLHIRKFLLKVDARFTPSSIRATLSTAAQRVLALPEAKGLHIYFDVDPL